MELSYRSGKFLVEYDGSLPEPHTSDKLKRLGFKHNRLDGYFTTSIQSAAHLRDYADERAEKIFHKAFIQFTRWTGALTVPKGLSLLDHQPGSCRFSLSRSRSYLALAPGLGKTIVAAIIAGTLKKKVLYVCPPFLMLNTLEEFTKWAPHLHTKILGNDDYIVPDVLIVPDSMVTNKDVVKYVKVFAPQVFFGDEWHRFKTETAQRSKAVYGYTDRRKTPPYQPGLLDIKSLEKKIFLSGTPCPNGRPMELFTVLKKCAGEFIEFMPQHQFGVKYCEAFVIKNEWTGQQYGYDYTGCDEENFIKLMKKVRTKKTDNMTAFMLRLDKKILGLPPVTEEIVILGDDMPRELKSMDEEMLRLYSPKDLLRLSIKLAMGKATEQEEVHLMTYRRLLGEHKVKPSCEYIESILEETTENIFIVAIHKEVIALIAERLKKYSPIVVTGDVPVKKRDALVKSYQAGRSRVIIGNIDAIGVGFTLTMAHRVLLVEYKYSPGENRQVIDRVHRYGLNHELLAQYLVFRNSLDRSTIETVLHKQKIIKHV
jgi:SWI/SNF-related matrix-associated actin-dependent regulator 1 of chromatin subfamily A